MQKENFRYKRHRPLTEWHICYRELGIMVYWHIGKKAACIHSQVKGVSSSEGKDGETSVFCVVLACLWFLGCSWFAEKQYFRLVYKEHSYGYLTGKSIRMFRCLCQTYPLNLTMD
ncbi:MAG: Tn3 family transposase [Chloroflexi bacterium]|nr:Tn3 family transposase [Chloroflexota bacterium]